ncbi:MAG: hypothetical protein A2015_09130 [Spirochaetes bacterium GWF1_31_7]|nr:MAG: hypothetical protein A2Y30_09090 [Spirochaetes bacterium GWE1_32_154]OHD44859.1 MAG: hypothetical protein A2Y29_09290 [Spirochaetes bacterium GWE2_31_10]OHD47650.1 MAG: hypothetical protein A2015_09130 [Spirochaetes bacterium GWF1_31_7]HBD94427.1 hypothetical protein [Spirochaetia bacterium]HBI37673.1 hypothetical protein [Spirochaetia bacterium]
MKFLYLLFFFSILLSCNDHIIEKNRYRERNPIEKIEINMKSGTLVINGWHENYIDIYVEKTLMSGLKSDISFLSTDILSDQNNKKLVLTAKQPDRINGEINLLLNIPYSIQSAFISTNSTKTTISQYIGDIIYTSDTGDLYMDVYGSISKFKTHEGNININIIPNGTINLLINNNYGDTNVNFPKSLNQTFIDIKSINGNITFNTKSMETISLSAISTNIITFDQKKLPHALNARNNDYFTLQYESNNPLGDIFIKNDNGFIFFNLF